jgi:hypothetical protein
MQRLRLKDGAPDEPDSGDWDAYAIQQRRGERDAREISCFKTAPAGGTIS